jgi:predicted lipid-binding transport protein (Tim44 family)
LVNTEYRKGNSCCGDNLLMFIWGDPDAFQRTVEAEQRLRDRNERDPEQAPRPEPGDIYILVGAIVGLIVGGAVGAIVGSHYFGSAGFFYGLFGGILAGGIIGATVGSLIKKRREKTKTGAQRPF